MIVDVEALTNWYVKHLGSPVDDEGFVVLRWGDDCAADTFEDMNGRFGHCRDPEGNRIQLWQPHPGM